MCLNMGGRKLAREEYRGAWWDKHVTSFYYVFFPVASASVVLGYVICILNA